ncbi:hypothetical protein TgHK011_005852 [Trichoderma gracile]|nr:hypothetical protein TgHK011_005852 [Trichoderma gracile]
MHGASTAYRTSTPIFAARHLQLVAGDPTSVNDSGRSVAPSSPRLVDRTRASALLASKLCIVVLVVVVVVFLSTISPSCVFPPGGSAVAVERHRLSPRLASPRLA